MDTVKAFDDCISIEAVIKGFLFLHCKMQHENRKDKHSFCYPAIYW